MRRRDFLTYGTSFLGGAYLASDNIAVSYADEYSPKMTKNDKSVIFLWMGGLTVFMISSILLHLPWIPASSLSMSRMKPSFSSDIRFEKQKKRSDSKYWVEMTASLPYFQKQ